MTPSLRVVVDTNVSVSALLLPRSKPRRAFDRCLEAGRLLVSASTVAELDEVLRRRKFDSYLREEKRLAFLAAMIREAEVVNVTQVITECRDPKDNKFLELAISGAASHILTGDADLLAMHPFRGVAVLTLQDFLDEQTSH
jgi:putative PIN family toxin of toxin-antitoxin system